MFGHETLSDIFAKIVERPPQTFLPNVTGVMLYVCMLYLANPDSVVQVISS